MHWSRMAILFWGIILMTFPIQGMAQVQAEVQVSIETPLHAINPEIFGQFIEHYGRVVEHGVWAELLQNRKFYPFDAVGQMNVAAPWTGDPEEKNVSFAIDCTLSIDGVSSQRIVLSGPSKEWRGVWQ